MAQGCGQPSDSPWGVGEGPDGQTRSHSSARLPGNGDSEGLARTPQACGPASLFFLPSLFRHPILYQEVMLLGKPREKQDSNQSQRATCQGSTPASSPPTNRRPRPRAGKGQWDRPDGSAWPRIAPWGHLSPSPQCLCADGAGASASSPQRGFHEPALKGT